MPLSAVGELVDIPTDSMKASFSPHPSWPVMFCLFGHSHSSRCGVTSYCGFDLHSCDGWVEDYFSSCIYGPFACLLLTNVYVVLSPIFKVFFFTFEPGVCYVILILICNINM